MLQKILTLIKSWLTKPAPKVEEPTKVDPPKKEEPKVEAPKQYAFGSDDWYFDRYRSFVVDREQLRDLTRAIQVIYDNKNRYVFIEHVTHIPWQMVAAIHWREASLNFNTCLHNGDPLPGPTRNVPRGRGPFDSWQQAAVDALRFDGLDKYNYTDQWTIVDMLKSMEAYNGWGYKKRGLASCYLWSCTDKIHPSGRYTYDGKFDSNARTNDYLGAACILRELLPKDKV